eukprot:m.340739 g.340739  ORF g.340739 m.340739 type:complete len:207 (-) comp19493_c0_seq1:90-710(-)
MTSATEATARSGNHLNFINEEHSKTVAALHEEIEVLRRRNLELSLQVISSDDNHELVQKNLSLEDDLKALRKEFEAVRIEHLNKTDSFNKEIHRLRDSHSKEMEQRDEGLKELALENETLRSMVDEYKKAEKKKAEAIKQHIRRETLQVKISKVEENPLAQEGAANIKAIRRRSLPNYPVPVPPISGQPPAQQRYVRHRSHLHINK